MGLARIGDNERVYSGGGGVGARYRLTRSRISTAVEVQVGLRPSSGVQESGIVEVTEGENVSLQAYEAEPSVGTAHGSFELQMGYSLSFFWLSATGGVRAFTNDRLEPAFYVNGQIGWITTFDLTFDLHFNWYHSSGTIGPLNVYGAGQTRYLGIGVGASYWMTDHVALHLGFDGVLFATANAATPALQIGVAFR